MTDETITSMRNPKISELLALQEKPRARKEAGLFVVEGVREVQNCLEGGYELRSLFYCPDIISKETLPKCTATVFAVAPQVYGKIAYRGGTEGVIAEGKMLPAKSPEKLNLPPAPLILVLESVEKPGNLGAVLRTADAAGVDAVIVCDPLTDLYNPNLIRASIGGVFTQNIACCTSETAISWLKSSGIKIFTAQLQDSELYYDTDMTGPVAIVFGTESQGLTMPWRDASSEKIRIPMKGKLDSLNVSVSAAILCYEAVRQRR